MPRCFTGSMRNESRLAEAVEEQCEKLLGVTVEHSAFAVLVRIARWFVSRVCTWSGLPCVHTQSQADLQGPCPNGKRGSRAKV